MTWAEISIVTTILTEAALTYLLIVLWRQPSSEPEDDTISPLLRQTAKLSVIAWGLWIAINLLRVGIVPFSYESIVEQAARVGMRIPTYWDVMWEPLRPILDAVPAYLVPYLVLRRMRKAPLVAEAATLPTGGGSESPGEGSPG